MGHFFPWDILSLGMFCPWNALSMGPYVWGGPYVPGMCCLGMFCPMGRFVHGTLCLGRTLYPRDVLPWEVLSVHQQSYRHHQTELPVLTN